jgi:hypothetical protein
MSWFSSHYIQKERIGCDINLLLSFALMVSGGGGVGGGGPGGGGPGGGGFEEGSVGGGGIGGGGPIGFPAEEQGNSGGREPPRLPGTDTGGKPGGKVWEQSGLNVKLYEQVDFRATRIISFGSFAGSPQFHHPLILY